MGNKCSITGNWLKHFLACMFSWPLFCLREQHISSNKSVLKHMIVFSNSLNKKIMNGIGQN